MKKVLILKNIRRESGGLIEDMLKLKRVVFDTLELDDNHACEFPLSHYSAVIVLGGPDSANDQTLKMRHELIKIKHIVDQNIPYLGVCLGLQTLVKACGGAVIRNPEKEVGLRHTDQQLYEVLLTPAGRKDPLCAGLPEKFPVLQLHGETVVVTPTMTVLGTGVSCVNQFVKCGPRQYGVQFHLEVTPQLLKQWLAEDDDLLQANREQVQADFTQLQTALQDNGTKLITNFLRLAGVIR
jgi:GMP synthase-like glutamine amidotransferase